MTSFVIAESRKPRKAAVIERLTGDFNTEYRVIVSQRYANRKQAVDAFLSELEPGEMDKYKERLKKSKP